jgi:AAHS family 4-hydroxybenzoate transporter-like MFS transporter
MVPRIDASILIERQKRSAFLAGLIVMICITAFLEGFDAQIQGYTAPAIIKLWHIDQAAFSPVFVSFQFALLAGALSLANLGDIYGRRPVIVGCVALFGIFTAAGALTHDVPALAATRFLSAIFLGGAMPNAIALTVDYAP